jgi:histidine triad (HIT) family protein
MNDIFDKIIAKEIPADIIYEDEFTLSFLDIKPVNHGHALVVPKTHFVNVFDGDPEILGRMMQAAQKVAHALRTVTGCDGVNITMNNEHAAGQEVFHAHLHIIPRFTGDNAFGGVRHLPYEEEASKALATSLREQLS